MEPARSNNLISDNIGELMKRVEFTPDDDLEEDDGQNPATTEEAALESTSSANQRLM